jgi:cytochrome c553
MMKSILLGLVAGAVLFAATANAGDAAIGKAKSAACIACHGSAGISPTPIWPNLAGQKEQYLVAQLKAFKEGTRQNAQMAPMVASLSDEDMANLAAYYASLPCQ